MSVGITQIVTGQAAGANFVARVPIQYERDRQAWPQLQVYDETNAAIIVDFYGPRLVDVHTGGNNLATLINANGSFPQALVAGTVYNITDGSSGTITAVSGDMTTITATLAGGTDNDWDTNDVHMIVPPNEDSWVWCETFTWELPTIARNGVAADCTSFSFKMMNANTEGLCYWHQAELLENLIDNPSLETGAGNPYIPSGWTNVDLDVGDTQTEAAVIHSGSESLRFNIGASGEGIRQQITAAIGDFVHVSIWSYGDGSAGFTIGGLDATQLLLQYSDSAFNVATPHTAVWSLTQAVFRVIATNPSIYILADAGAAGARYIDDIMVI